MSTRRARIKAVTSLPPRRKNNDVTEETKAKNIEKESNEKPIRSPRTPRGSIRPQDNFDRRSPKPGSPLKSPRTVNNVFKYQAERVPSPLAQTEVTKEVSVTPKRSEKVSVITSVYSAKSNNVFVSPRSVASPLRRHAVSPLVHSSRVEVNVQRLTPVLSEKVPEKPKQKSVERKPANTDTTDGKSKEARKDVVSTVTSDVPDDYSVPSVPESITEDTVMDGIVPLQAVSSAPKPLAMLKNEIISENAEVLFDPIVPLPSPSKVRPKLRPVPRLAPLRRNSVQGSASESEDESRRALLSGGGASTPAPPRQRHDSHTSHSTMHSLPNREVNRIRNDSVCSSVSQATTQPAPASSPVKEKHVSKSRRLDMSRRTAAMRRRREAVKKDTMTMYDLIFYNPTSNPIVPDKDEIKAQEANKEAKEEAARNAAVKKTDDKVEDQSEPETDAAPVPQIKLGPNGEIMLDEQSLVIKQSEKRKVSSSVVHEGAWGTGSTSGRYRRTPRTADWSDAETVRFYRALAALGTDFMLMENLFPGRTRRDLKLKFKKEERVNMAQVDKALRMTCKWDAARLVDEFQAEREEADRAARAEAAELQRRARDQRQRQKEAREMRVRMSKYTRVDELQAEREEAAELQRRARDQRQRQKEAREMRVRMSKYTRVDELQAEREEAAELQRRARDQRQRQKEAREMRVRMSKYTRVDELQAEREEAAELQRRARDQRQRQKEAREMRVRMSKYTRVDELQAEREEAAELQRRARDQRQRQKEAREMRVRMSKYTRVDELQAEREEAAELQRRARDQRQRQKEAREMRVRMSKYTRVDELQAEREEAAELQRRARDQRQRQKEAREMRVRMSKYTRVDELQAEREEAAELQRRARDQRQRQKEAREMRVRMSKYTRVDELQAEREEAAELQRRARDQRQRQKEAREMRVRMSKYTRVDELQAEREEAAELQRRARDQRQRQKEAREMRVRMSKYTRVDELQAEREEAAELQRRARDQRQRQKEAREMRVRMSKYTRVDELQAEREEAAELQRRARDQRQRQKEAREMRVRMSRSSKALGSSSLPTASGGLTADEVIQRHHEAKAILEKSHQRATRSRPKSTPSAQFATITRLAPAKPPNDMATLRKIDPSKPQVDKQPPTTPVVPSNIENGSLVVLTVNDPNSPSKKMLQTYIASGGGRLTPVALPTSFLNSVVTYMKKGGTPKSNAGSSPHLTSPSSVASQDSRPCSTPGVIQMNNSPAKRKRHSSYTITQL